MDEDNSTDMCWSDDEEYLEYFEFNNSIKIPRATYGGSRVGKSKNIERDFIEAEQRLKRYYFDDDLLYSPATFHRRFRISKHLF